MITLQDLIREDFGYESGSGIWGKSRAHDSLVVNEEKQTWFWNSRGIFGDIESYLVKVRGMSRKNARELCKAWGIDKGLHFVGNKEEVEKSVIYDKLVDSFVENGRDHREYWYKRCLKDSTIDNYRLGYYKGWYTVPMLSGDTLINIQLRRDAPTKRIIQWYKGTKPVLFNSDILGFVSEIVITEGTIDAILLTQEGIPAVSHNGSNIWMPEWYSLFSRINTIYYVEDNDNAGKSAGKMVAKALGVDRVKTLRFGKSYPEKYDTVDFFRDGGDSKSFREFLNSHTRYIYQWEN